MKSDVAFALCFAGCKRHCRSIRFTNAGQCGNIHAIYASITVLNKRFSLLYLTFASTVPAISIRIPLFCSWRHQHWMAYHFLTYKFIIMKYLISQLACAIFFIFIASTSYGQGMSMNTTGAAADASAMLDVASTTKGFLPPRMTSAQRNAISTPATGLVVYQTDGNMGLYCNNGTSSAPNWQLIGPKVSLAYGYFYSTLTQNVPLANVYSNVSLNNASAINNLYFFTGIGAVTIVTGGLYSISYMLEGTSLSVPVSIAGRITVNGTGILPVSVGTVNTVATYVPIQGEILLSLIAGDVIYLQYAAMNTISSISPSYYFSGTASAYLSITQIQ